MKQKILALFIFFLFIYALQNISKNYYAIMPGGIYALSDAITVNGVKRTEPGSFYMTTTIAPQMNWIILLAGIFNPDIDIYSFYSISSNTPSLIHLTMEDSKNEAKFMAFKTAKGNTGIRILELLQGSPLFGKAVPGDKIIGLAEKKFPTTRDLITVLSSKNIKDTIDIVIRDRNGGTSSYSVNLVPHTQDFNRAALRIIATDEQINDYRVEIFTDMIYGPSGGLMFFLEIIDRLLPENLTKGYRIAGTGVLVGEKIGPVSGVRQKVISAEKGNIDYFIVPYENYKEAVSVGKDIRIIPVKTVDDTLNFLRSLE